MRSLVVVGQVRIGSREECLAVAVPLYRLLKATMLGCVPLPTAFTGKTTKSFALVVLDPDAPGGTFIHWVAYNIPAQMMSLPANVPQTAEIAGGGKNGINGFNHIGYNGPCPPPGKMHHYNFRLFALDSALTPGDKPDAVAVESAMKGHVLATAELVGTFER